MCFISKLEGKEESKEENITVIKLENIPVTSSLKKNS
jgi:hypothetical protein